MKKAEWGNRKCLLIDRDNIVFRGDEMLKDEGVVTVTQFFEYTKNHCIVHFELQVYELYPNRAVLFSSALYCFYGGINWHNDCEKQCGNGFQTCMQFRNSWSI